MKEAKELELRERELQIWDGGAMTARFGWIAETGVRTTGEKG